MGESRFRQAVREALRTLNSSTEAAIRRELSKSFDLGHSGKLQFEISDYDFRIALTQTKEDVVAEFAVDNAIPDAVQNAAQDNEIDLFEMITDEIVPWFADRWRAAEGPDNYSPAYVFFHGGLESQRYDLEQNRWYPIQEVWSDD